MVENLVNLLEIYVLPWGALGVFVASVLEEVVAPIPSALIMTMSGFIFVTGGVSFSSISTLIFVVAIPASLGVTIGSYFIYFIARYGGKFTIEKWGKYVGLYFSDIEKLQNKLSGTKKDEILIGSARILPIVPSVAISAFCGIMEMNLVKYFFITLIGTFFRGLILGAIGWQVGNVYEMYADLINSIEKIVLLSTIFGLAVFVVLKYKGRLGN